MRRRLGGERIALLALVFIGLWLSRGRGWAGFGLFLAAAALLGLVVGLLGRRYPMIYPQNRREQRRRASNRR